MEWRKMGHVFSQNGDGWRSHSALTPTPLLLNDDVIRVYAGFRDNEGIQAYLASGWPISAMINGKVAKVVQSANAGFTFPSGSTQALAKITKMLFGRFANDRDRMGESGRRYYKNHYSKIMLLLRIECLFHNAKRCGVWYL